MKDWSNMEDATALNDTYLCNWFADVRSTTTRAKALFDDLGEQQKLWKPVVKVWSVAECFDHLVVTADLYYSGLADAIDRAGPSGEATKPFRARWFQGKFIAAIGPQSRRKGKTFKIFEPRVADLDVARVEKDFLDRQTRLADLIRQADGRDLNDGKVYSPLTKLLSFTVGEVIWLLTAHAERHLLQARNLTRLEGFPGVPSPQPSPSEGEGAREGSPELRQHVE